MTSFARIFLAPAILLAAMGIEAKAAPGSVASPRPEASGPTIDQIEIVGVKALSSDSVQSAVEVAPGEKADSAKIKKAIESLEKYYKTRGYEQARVRARLLRRENETPHLTVLEFTVREGLPTRIASIDFIPEFPEGSASSSLVHKHWKNIEPKLASSANLEPGQINDEDQLAGTRRAIQETLGTEDYIGARVDSVDAVDVPAPHGHESDIAARWVKLEFHVELGDHVTFGFRGNKAFTNSQFYAMIEEQKTLGLSHDYVSAIRKTIESAYADEGYAFAQAEPYTLERPEGRHVTYIINEGRKVTIDSIGFDGNQVFSDEELRKVLMEKGSTLMQSGYFVEKDVQKAAELMIEWIKSKGYLSAKLVTINSSLADKRKLPVKEQPVSVKVVVYLYEGAQTIVQKVNLQGVRALSPSKVRSILGVKEGEPLNLFAFSEGIQALKSTYRAQGYLEMRIANESTDTVVKYSQENRIADINLDISEGSQYRVSQVEIEGLSQTKEQVVKRELTLRQGDILKEPQIAESEARLRRLGIFSSVHMQTIDDPAQPDHKILRVSLQEGEPGIVAGGPGFRNDLGIRGFGQLAYANLWGLDQTVSLSVATNHRFEDFHFEEYQAQLAYIWPWFMGLDLKFRPTLTLSQTEFLYFDARDLEAALTWEKTLWRNPNLTLSLTYSLEAINQFNATLYPSLDDQDLRIGTLSPGITIDTRDSVLSPTSGYFLSANFEIASPWLFSQTDPFPVGYTRFQLRSDFFVPLTREMSWYISFRTGYERNSEVPDPNNPQSGQIPISKLFALGGIGSLRGYSEQELNVFSETAIRGTLSYVNYRTQLDLPFLGALRFGPFLDAANLLVDQFSFSSLDYGAGVGFHYKTPVGPVNLDWGFKVPQTSQYQFYFSIGVI